MWTVIAWFVGMALVGAVIQQTKPFGRAMPLAFFLGFGGFVAASICLLIVPPLSFYAIAGGLGWVAGFASVLLVSMLRTKPQA